MDRLRTIEDKLLLPENEVVAVIRPDIAHAIHENIVYEGSQNGCLIGEENCAIGTKGENTEGPNYRDKSIKASSLFMGLSGSIGKVDMFQPYTNTTSLVTTVHIPNQIFPFVELIRGEEGLDKFYQEFFTQTEGDEWKGRQWNIRGKKSNIDRKSVDFPFISEHGYNWKVEKVRTDIFEDGRPLEVQVKDHEDAAKKFIQRLDKYLLEIIPSPVRKIQSITHETAKTHYDKLQQGKMRLIWQFF